MACGLNFLQSMREDDFVEYFLFPGVSCRDTGEEESSLRSVLKQINKIVDKCSKNYLWHRDEFKLVPRTSDSNFLIQADEEDCLPPHLYGITHFGDNIEDEWFIVYLLMQITKEIDGLVARIVDIDGEFLLIEAADYLPSWANPEVCEKRVYLYQGFLHILAPEKTADNAELANVKVKTAISKVVQTSHVTKADKEIQNSILNRVKGYPDSIVTNLHHSNVFLPVGVAAILKHKPNLIAPAVQAFCNRDSIDLKACRAMKYFPPESRIFTYVTFTRCLYAMLTHSKYIPDRRTGWDLPEASNSQYKSHSLGVKIASGFEILASQAKPSEDIENDKGWKIYLESLQENNYFKGLLEHSRDYNNLLNKAKEYYISNRDSMQSTPALGEEILNLTKTIEYNLEDLKKAESNLPKDDDETWLNINPEDLDKMLQERYGQKKIFSVNGNADPSTFTSKVANFLNHISDVEGAEFPAAEEGNEAKESPTRPPRGIKRKGKNRVSFSSDTKVEEKPTNINKINFDPSSFSCAVQSILDFMIPDDDTWDLESDSDMSDYSEDANLNLEGCEDVKNKMEQYMEEMDKELAKTTIGQSFVKQEKGMNDTFDDVETFEPVDIDMNSLKNILESYQAQMGDAGPASNMLGPMGIHLEAGPENGDAS